MLHTIRKHLRYAKYLLSHKFWVTYHCFKDGLYWQGLIHDWDKFIPWKWCAYANHFCTDEAQERKKKIIKKGKGYFHKKDDDEAFNKAWKSHYTMQPHHPKYYLNADGTVDNMPIKYIREMICDWRGASMCQLGHDDIIPWYKINGKDLKLSRLTRHRVERLIYEGKYRGF